MDWAISQMCSLTLSTVHCDGKAPFCCQFPMVSTAHQLATTPGFLAPMRTCRVGIWIVIASMTTDFGNQKASDYILGSQRWSMIEWCITNAHYSKQVSGVLNILSRVMQCSSRGEEGVLNVLGIVSIVGRQGNHRCGLERVILIRWHQHGCYSATKHFA